MADLSITATSVAKVTSPVPGIDQYVATATITAGQVVYLVDETAKTVGLADANATGKKTVLGIALNGGATGQVIVVQKTGRITIGASLTTADVYTLSATAGGIAPIGDLASGWDLSLIGYAISATVIELAIHNSGIAKA